MFAQEGRLTVQGTAIVRVEPDLASVRFSVSRTAPTPADAFASVRETTEGIRTFLTGVPNCELRSSRIGLNQHRELRGSTELHLLGYRAVADFSLIVSDLEALESLLSGLVSSGANQLSAVEFLTSRLKEIRAEARKKAVSAAREKANLYCDVAGVELGPILGLSDGHFDPAQRQGGHVQSSVSTDVDERIGTFSPSSIPVGASVNITYKLI
jgi:uncharacterized protein YggE